MTNDEKREILEEIIEKMEECAELIRSLHDGRLNAYCLAAFEGKDAGWLGHFERDTIEGELRALGLSEVRPTADEDEEDAS